MPRQAAGHKGGRLNYLAESRTFINTSRALSLSHHNVTLLHQHQQGCLSVPPPCPRLSVIDTSCPSSPSSTPSRLSPPHHHVPPSLPTMSLQVTCWQYVGSSTLPFCQTQMMHASTVLLRVCTVAAFLAALLASGLVCAAADALWLAVPVGMPVWDRTGRPPP